MFLLSLTVQRGGGGQGVLRHDAHRAAQSDAFWGRLYSSDGSHCQGLQTMAPHPGKIRWYVGYTESKYRLRISLAHPPDCHFAHVQ